MPDGFTEAWMLPGVFVPLDGAMLSHGSVSVAVKGVDPPVLLIDTVREVGKLPPI